MNQFVGNKFKNFKFYNSLKTPDHKLPTLCVTVNIVATAHHTLRRIKQITTLNVQNLSLTTFPLELDTYFTLPHYGFKTFPQEYGFIQAVRNATQNFYGVVLIVGQESTALFMRAFETFRFNHPDTQFHHQHTTPRPNLTFYQNPVPANSKLPELDYADLLSFMNIHNQVGLFTIPVNCHLLIKTNTKTTTFLTIYQMPTKSIEAETKVFFMKLWREIECVRPPARYAKPPLIPPQQRTKISDSCMTYQVSGQLNQPQGEPEPSDDDSQDSMPLEQSLVIDEGMVFSPNTVDEILKQAITSCTPVYTDISPPTTPLFTNIDPPSFSQHNTPSSSSQLQTFPQQQNSWNATTQGQFSGRSCATPAPHKAAQTLDITPEYVTLTLDNHASVGSAGPLKRFRHNATE
jgi:hypothetical protein